MKTHFDFVILGAGITGLSIGYWLYKLHPKASIAIFDSNKFLYGASGRNAGFLTVGSFKYYESNVKKFGSKKAREVLELSQKNHELLQQEGLVGDFCEYFRHGSYSISSETPQIEVPSEFQQRDSQIPLFNGETCYFYEADASIHPQKFLIHFRKQLPFPFFESSSIQWELKQKFLHANNQKITFDKIFLATNAWISQIVPTLNIQPQRAQVIKTSTAKNKILGCFYFSDSKVYFKQLEDQSFLIGGLRTHDTQVENTLELGLNLKIQKALQDFALSRIEPGLSITDSWSGIMGFSQDQLPISGCLPGDFTYYLAGFSGHGMGMAFESARRLIFSLN